jgi:sec-independent protein translocase protein TatA
MNPFIPAFLSPGPWQLLIVAGIVLLLFGSRLPSVMRSLGQSVVEFKKGIKDTDETDGDGTKGPSEKKNEAGV